MVVCALASPLSPCFSRPQVGLRDSLTPGLTKYERHVDLKEILQNFKASFTISRMAILKALSLKIMNARLSVTLPSLGLWE